MVIIITVWLETGNDHPGTPCHGWLAGCCSPWMISMFPRMTSKSCQSLDTRAIDRGAKDHSLQSAEPACRTIGAPHNLIMEARTLYNEAPRTPLSWLHTLSICQLLMYSTPTYITTCLTSDPHHPAANKASVLLGLCSDPVRKKALYKNGPEPWCRSVRPNSRAENLWSPKLTGWMPIKRVTREPI